MKFDHIGIFVKNLQFGDKHLKNIFPIVHKSQIYKDRLLKVTIQFCYDNCGVCYELVAPFGDGSPVDKVLEKNENILNHIAYTSEKFDYTVDQLRKVGCLPLGSANPAVAFKGKRVMFFLTPLRLIIEIIEA